MWRGRLWNGQEITEQSGRRWCEVPIHDLAELWLEEFPKFRLRRDELSGFVEFIQYKTALVGPGGESGLDSQTVAWTDGRREYGFRIQRRGPRAGRLRLVREQRRHYHPTSVRAERSVPV